jgi:hypothetical protein
MVTKQFQLVFLLVIFAGMLFLLIQGKTGFVKVKAELGGAYTKKSKPAFTIASWFEGTYQKNFEQYLEERAGFRAWFIQLRNQVDFTLFRHVHAQDVFVGNDNYLFRPSELNEINGKCAIPVDEMRKRIRQTKVLESELKKGGVPLIILIAPAKSHYYKEHIPGRLLIKGAKSFYEQFSAAMDTAGFNCIDMNKWFLEMKDTTTYPLYSRSGIHWTEYGSVLAMDSVMRYAEKLANKNFPQLRWNKLEVRKDPSDLDSDVLRAANLMKPFRQPPLAYPYLDTNLLPGEQKPNMLVVGDSYFHAILWRPTYRYFVQKESAFWYYNREAWSESYGNKLVSDLDILKELAGRDFVLMIYTPANLFEEFWALPRKMGDLLGAQ